MDYEKKYKEALERAEEVYHRGYYISGNIETIFPELKESEDERIRKAILELVRQSSEILDKQNQNNMIAWLEKQGEQKHFELKAGHWYICHRPYCCRADHLTVKGGERFMCEKDGVVKGFVIKDAQKYFKECNAPAPYEDTQDTTQFKCIGSDEVRRRSTIQVLEYARSLDAYNQYGKADIDKNIAWLEKPGEKKCVWNDTRKTTAPSNKDILGWYRKEDGILEDSPKIVWFCSDDEAIKEAELDSFHLAYWTELPNEKFDKKYWFEKQGDQKIDDDDKAILENCEDIVKDNNKTMLNACINTLRNVGHSHLAAWLEKQKPVESNEEFNDFVRWFVEERTKNPTLIPSDKDIKEWCKIILNHARKVLNDEWKPANEPKFKVGDWILYSGDYYEGVRHITKINENGYYIERNGLPHGIIPFNHEVCMRLWTIEDAKDGDVLASNKSIFIFQEEYIGEKPTAYGGLMNGLFIEGNDICWTNEKCYPATREQRELLFQKMKEAGYEWNAETKELKRIEQNPTWSEEDKEMFNYALDMIEGYSGKNESKSRVVSNWLKFLQERVQTQPKQEWSKEDEIMRKRAICACNFTIERTMSEGHYQEARDWLKSLPIGFITNPNYNEDMIELLVSELRQIANNNNSPKQYEKEIEWLKSLRPKSNRSLQCSQGKIYPYQRSSSGFCCSL